MRKLFLVGLLAAAAANATITPDLVVGGQTGPFCTPGPGVYCTYTYEAFLPENHYVQAGDFFTIYDFAGFVVGSTIGAPMNWAGEANLTGDNPVNPAITSIPDNGGVYNITWTYNGPRLEAGAAGINFTGFTAISELTGVGAGYYGGQTHKDTGVTIGNQPDSNAGRVDIPGTGGGDEPTVPEPMSMALFGAGLTAIGLLRLRKKS